MGWRGPEVTGSFPHTFRTPKQTWDFVSYFLVFVPAPHPPTPALRPHPPPALPAISQASCYSFLHSKWDGVLVSFYPLLKSFLHRSWLMLCLLKK